MTARSAYLTTGQAARQLGISVRTLGRAVDRGELPCARRTPGGWLLFLPAEVDAFARRLADPLTATSHRPALPAGGVAQHGGVSDRFVTLLCALPCGAVAVDRSGRVTMRNAVAERLGAGQESGDAVLDHPGARATALLAQALTGAPGPLVDSVVWAPTGQEQRRVQIQAAGLYDEQGALTGAFALLLEHVGTETGASRAREHAHDVVSPSS